MDLAFVEALEPAGPGSSAGWREGDAWLAGGTWLFSEPQPRLRRLLDLRAFGWEPLTLSETGLEIAATCTLAQLRSFGAEAGPEWPAAVLLVQCTEALYGSWKVWQEATVGGNLCLALPAGPMAALAAALDGTCTVWTADGAARLVPVADFVRGAGENALSPGDLLRSVTLPVDALRARTAFRRMSLSPRGRSAAVVTGRRQPGGETVIAVTAAVVRPLQLRFPGPPEATDLAAALESAEPVYHDDVHGDPLWRAWMTARLAEEVRAELVQDD